MGFLSLTLAPSLRSRDVNTAIVQRGVPEKTPSPQVAVATTATANGDYKLIVGGNPRINREQVLLPPTNSVVVTNEEQLRLLIEQTRPQSNTNSSQ